MRIADLVSIADVPRSLALTQLLDLREALEREQGARSLPTAGLLRELLTDYVASPGDEADAAVNAILGAIAQARGEGVGVLVQGPDGAGKSHLLLLVGLLLEYPEVWADYLSTHEHHRPVLSALAGRVRRLVVPVPLAEHRGRNEHLEDILFDRTEQELARARYGILAPLSDQTFALSLVRRHVLPRYQRELDARAREEHPEVNGWEELCAHSRRAATMVARGLAKELGYPLDFRQSRLERVSRLLELMRDNDFGGVVWLIDDLGPFLDSADPKAARGDVAFLEFLGQRAQISPFAVIAALRQGSDRAAEGDPPLTPSLRGAYAVTVCLGPGQSQAVAFGRAIRPALPQERYVGAIADTYARLRRAFGGCSFSEAELARSYPLHPTAARCLQSACLRFLDRADGLLEFARDPCGLGRLVERDFVRLIGPAEIAEYLRPQLASSPQAAAYYTQALDYYASNAGQFAPQDAAIALDVARTLLALRLGNVAATAELVAECLGVGDDHAPRIGAGRAQQILEDMRLTGSFVDVRRAADPQTTVYLLDVHTSLSELVRRRLTAMKASLPEDDDRVWRRALSACDSPAFPLAELAHSQTIEVTWRNSLRCITVETANTVSITPTQLNSYVSELGDPSTPQTCYLFVARVTGATAQARHWRRLCQGLPPTRWRAGLMAWIPRPLEPQELDVLRQCAACHELLREPAPDGEAQAAWRARLLEERQTLENQVRQICQRAYYEGQVVGGTNGLLEGERLAMLKGDWQPTVAAIADVALTELYPGFGRVAPRRPLESRRQIDMLVDEFIRVGYADRDPESALTEAVESFLGPMGLVREDSERLWLDASHSEAARAILDRLRRRDRTPQHERGRALDCAELAQHLMKSPLGLPPQLFELLAAALVRLGYLVALDAAGAPLRFEQIPSPFPSAVASLARAPLLPVSQWQTLARLARVVLDVGIAGPEPAVQQSVWEGLIDLRMAQMARLDRLEASLAKLRAELGRSARAWPSCDASIAQARSFYAIFDPVGHPSEAVFAMTPKLEPYLREGHGPSGLSTLLRRVDQIEAFLSRLGPDLVAAQRYLTSPDLTLEPGSDLDLRRQGLLELIAEADSLVGNEVAFRREAQVFIASYKRRYLGWHNRCHQSAVFDRYRAIKAGPEFRALCMLQPLAVEVGIDSRHVGQLVERRLAQRCQRADLGAALEVSPVCPDCRLRLDHPLDLPPPEQIEREIADGLAGYARALSEAPVADRLREYAQELDGGELAARLAGLTRLPAHPTGRDILAAASDELIARANLALEGRRVATRRLADLRERLAGRSLSLAEAREALDEWLAGENGLPADDDSLLIQ